MPRVSFRSAFCSASAVSIAFCGMAGFPRGVHAETASVAQVGISANAQAPASATREAASPNSDVAAAAPSNALISNQGSSPAGVEALKLPASDRELPLTKPIARLELTKPALVDSSPSGRSGAVKLLALSPPALLQPTRPPPAPWGRRFHPSQTPNLSGWAWWNSNLAGATATTLSFMCTMVVGFTFLPSDETGWGRPKFEGLKGNFREGPRFDNDRTYWNYVFHPIEGSEFYLVGRNRGLTWWQGLTYSFLMSGTFEYFIESAYERASWQDLWITPITGAAIGELRWQAKKALEDDKTGKPVGTLKKVLYVVLDPLDALSTL
jgi:hypothetical protein